jgi:hypothetical protein
LALVMGRPDTGTKTRTAERGGGKRFWLWTVSAAVVAAAVAGVFAYRAAVAEPGVSLPDQGNRHVPTLTEEISPYNSDPPTSGPHLPYIAPWGVHTEPIPRQLQVHNLEDGGVMVQFNCPDGCPDLVAKLKAVVAGYERQVILAPYPGMKTRLALTAWTRLDAFDDFDEKRVRGFIKAYRGIDHHPR